MGHLIYSDAGARIQKPSYAECLAFGNGLGLQWPQFPFASVAPFTPTSVANLLAWYKADALVSKSGSNVTAWGDSTGNGYTASQATGGAQPTQTATAPSGLPVITFASGQYLDATAFAGVLAGNPNATVFVVFAPAATAGACVVGWGNSGASLGTLGLCHNVRGAGTFSVEYTNNQDTYAAAVTQNVYQQYTYLKAAGAINTTASAYRNGISQAHGATSTTTPAISAATGLRIGNGLGGAATTLPYIGGLAEILIYGRVVTTTERQAVETYCQSRWGY